MLYPNLSDKHLLIMPGHVGKSSGTIALAHHGDYGYVSEAGVNLDIVWHLFRQLHLHCEENVLLDLGHGTWGRKAKMAEALQPDLTIEIHCNAYDDPAVRGFEAWTGGDPDSIEAATHILKAVASGNPIPPHGVPNGLHDIYKEDNPRRKLFETVQHRPLVLLECGFLTNKEDCGLLVTEMFQELLALKIGFGFDSYFGTAAGGSGVAGTGGGNL